jgi:XTP/dITP diphosphohydrolase
MTQLLNNLVFATNNHHKLKEAEGILPERFGIRSLRDIGCEDELPETGATLEANAFQKANYVHEKFGVICFSDDTGLEVDALDGAPGVFSARYAGLPPDSEKNVERLLRELQGVTDRRARFRTVICLLGMGEPIYFNGTVEGTITVVRKGDGGFGYDPVFLPDGSGLTFSEMNPSEKNAISHRGRALQAMRRWLESANVL